VIGWSSCRSEAAGSATVTVKLTVVAALAMVLSGCTTYWTRDPGMGGFARAQFEQDVARCERGFSGGWSGLHGLAHHESQKNEYLHNCLQAMGYRRISREEAERLGYAK